MASVIEAEAEVGPAAAYRPHRMTVERYERLCASGVYGADEPVFLWRGGLVEKMAPGGRHVFAMVMLTRQFVRVVPEGWFCLFEQPVVVGDESLPEPDIAVVRGSPRDYLGGRSTARSTCLIAEVADSSLAIDSGDALALYASESIPIYWIVNLPAGRIEVYGDPTGPADAPTYRGRRDYGRGGAVPVVLDGVEVGHVAVDEVLP